MESKVSRRLQQATAPQVCEHIYLPRLHREFASGFDYLTRINQAHLLMLHKAGLIPGEQAAQLARTLLSIAQAGPQAVPLDPQREDAYFNYEARIMELAGADTGGRLHVARSRNDILATHDRLRARDMALAIAARMCALRDITLARAAAYTGTVMPGYTHLQAAQPITYGYYLAAIADAFGRDVDRLCRAVRALDACPLGAGALAGTAFPIIRDETARLLGFSRSVGNSLDAVASRDYAWEIMSTLVGAAVTWSRVAQDYYVWATPEFGLIDFPDSVAGTSSIMPQKKNPVVLEYLKGKGAHMIGLLTSALSTVKGSHFTHSGDGNRESMRSFWECADECLRSLDLLTLIVGAAEPRREDMLRRARDDFSCATDLADTLVRRSGISFRQAHYIVGAAVRQALDAGLPASAIDTGMIDAAAQSQLGRPMSLPAGIVRDCLDPAASVAARSIPGGPAPSAVMESIAGQRQDLIEAEQAVQAEQAKVTAAKAQLQRETADLAGRGI